MPRYSVTDQRERERELAGRSTRPARRATALPRAVGRLSEAPSRRSVEVRESSYRHLLAWADALAAFAALYGAVVVFGDDHLRPTSLLTMPLAVVASKLSGLYDRDELVLKKTTLEETGPLFRMATLFALVTWLLDGIVVDGYLGNRQVLGLW